MADLDAYRPFDAGAGSTNQEAEWRTMGRFMSQSGVDLSYLNGVSVYGDSSGRQVKVRTGRLWVDGHYGEVTSEKTISLTTNGAGNPRIDRIVAQVNPTDNKITIEVVTGTAAATPAKPALTQSPTGIYQIPLAYVTVASGYTTVAAADVTDERAVAIGPSGATGYQEIGRTTLASAGDTLACSFPVRKFLKVVVFMIDSGGTIDPEFTLNGDGGTNYAYRSSTSGAADATATSDTNVDLFASAEAEPTLGVIYFTNVTDQQKLFHGVFTRENAAGAGNAPDRQEMSGKWNNTTAQIASISFTNGGGAGDYAIGSDLIVYGHD